MRDTFTKRCMAINIRLHDTPSDALEKTILHRVYAPGPISRNYRHRHIHYCSECGCEVEWKGQKECTQCHARWKAKPKPFEREIDYHMVMEAKDDIQLCRFYRVERRTKFGERVSSMVWEVERIMYAPTGERRVFARGVQGLSMYYDAFCYWSPVTMKRESSTMSYRATLRYNLEVYNFHIKSLTKQWRYKEIPALLKSYNNDTSVLRVIAYPWAETMRKTGQELLFRYLVCRMKMLPKGTAHALNICHRNNYEISDPSLWIDNLELLKHFRMDTHSPHYVCPKDLRSLHQELLIRKRREDERKASERRQREEQERIRKDKAYADMLQHWPEHMGNILKLSLTGKNLTIRPLQSVDEFRQEGDAMHHCVYRMKYYDYNRHPNCLILSAKDEHGNRLATIEYDTKRNDIVQCRAACNQVPERDTEIRQLITSHRSEFKRLMKVA